VVVVPPRIYLLGGASAAGALASNLYYDTMLNAWSGHCSAATSKPCSVPGDCTGTDGACLVPLPDLPQARSHPAGARAPDGSLVVAGGLSGITSDTQAADVWVLPPLGQQWQTAPAMPTARGGCAYGVIQDQLVCAGGEAGMSAYTVVESFDLIGQTWRSLPAMPAPRAGTQGGVVGTRLFVPGGAARIAFEPEMSIYVFSALDTAN
jgi:hypothetical protein